MILLILCLEFHLLDEISTSEFERHPRWYLLTILTKSLCQLGWLSIKLFRHTQSYYMIFDEGSASQQCMTFFVFTNGQSCCTYESTTRPTWLFHERQHLNASYIASWIFLISLISSILHLLSNDTAAHVALQFETNIRFAPLVIETAFYTINCIQAQNSITSVGFQLAYNMVCLSTLRLHRRSQKLSPSWERVFKTLSFAILKKELRTNHLVNNTAVACLCLYIETLSIGCFRLHWTAWRSNKVRWWTNPSSPTSLKSFSQNAEAVEFWKAHRVFPDDASSLILWDLDLLSARWPCEFPRWNPALRFLSRATFSTIEVLSYPTRFPSICSHVDDPTSRINLEEAECGGTRVTPNAVFRVTAVLPNRARLRRSLQTFHVAVWVLRHVCRTLASRTPLYRTG